MTKVVDIGKRQDNWVEIATMLELFITQLLDDKNDLADQIKDAVLVYTLKDGGVIFETTSKTDVNSVGMMCSAVHIACVYETGDPTPH